MQRIAIFGKGGIGKSTLAANLAAVYALQGRKVLLVGCDPKHDTTVSLTEGKPIRTVVEAAAFMDSSDQDLSRILVRGRLGIDCVEAGGPEPGIGCAGRGISRTIDILNSAGVLSSGRHDVALFDVLGDVVCGGFAAPLRQGFADKVVIVTSEELMSLYAVNNIARAVRNYSANGIALAGLVANLRDPGADRQAVARFAARLGTRVLDFLPREAAVREAEYLRRTVVEHAPRCEVARKITALAGKLLACGRRGVPTPLTDESFHELSRAAFVSSRVRPEPEPAAPAPGEPRPAEQGAPPSGAPGPQREWRPGPSPLETDLSWQASLWEGQVGPNSQVWGDPGQWRRFFCDFETRRHVRMCLEGSTPVVNLWHQDLECSYSTPDYYDASLPAFFKFPWPSLTAKAGAPGAAGPQDGRAPDGRRAGGPRGKGPGRKGPAPDRGGDDIMTNLKDLDVIHGGGRKLDEAIKAAVARAEGRASAIVVHSTCIPTVIGDDAEAVVARWQGRSRIPIVYVNHTEGSCQDFDVSLILFKKMQQDPSFAKVARRSRSVNLVGFPGGPGLDELTRLLTETGITVNACVMPALGVETARRYLAAEAQVFYPNGAYEDTYRKYFEPLPIKTLRAPSPYGLEGTRLWLESVAALFGLQGKARAAARAAQRALAADWQRERGAAAGHSLAFVVDPAHLKRLTDPRQTWGVPVVSLLRELGFGVEVLCHGRASKAGSSLSFFQTQEELAALLRQGSFQAVYSEYAFDSRLARAGKSQFSLDCFEVGQAGALRSLVKLNGLCRWPFQRRYARYMGEE